MQKRFSVQIILKPVAVCEIHKLMGVKQNMKIGLSYTGDEMKHRNYSNWLKGNDDMEIIRLSVDENNAHLLNDCDALVLSGGIDIDPQITLGQQEYPNKPDVFQPERDLFEKELYEKAAHVQMPVLGICRGMQLVNVLLGGTLRVDLGPLNSTHKKDGSTDKSHTVMIESNTLLYDIVQTGNGEINSAHHQAIDQLGEGLRANSIAADGTIEGLEWADKNNKPFLLCVQWHPERMFQFPGSPLSVNIRNRFIEEIKSTFKSRYENN